jgi:outer membrane protein assembly factor BamD
MPMGKKQMTRLMPAGLLLGALLLSACESKKKETYVDLPVETLYNQASDAMMTGEYDVAARLFEEVEQQHPYSVWATKAQLMAAYSYYLKDKFDEAILAADRFIQLHPGNRDAAYAYYLKAISYYAQIADVQRDQGLTELAMNMLNEVVRRFPESPYARDARVKYDLTRDHMAGKEMEIGRYYMKSGHYGAAVARFRQVIERFQTTSHVPEALLRLTECYLAIGVKEEAQTAAAVLGHNFPGSDWYEDAYALLTGVKLQPRENEGSWISRAFKSVF